MRRVGVGSRLLHVRAFLIRVGSDRLAGLQLADSVSEFGESFHQTVDRGLVGVVGDGDGLAVDVGHDFLHTFFKAQVALDFVLAVLAVHLRRGGEHSCLDGLCHGCDGNQPHREG